MVLSGSNRLMQEFSQAKLRLAVVAITLLFVTLGQYSTSIIFVASTYFIYSIVNFYWIKKTQKESTYRAYIHIVGDISALSAVIYFIDINAIIIYPALLWMIIGYGIRFGVKSLFITLAVSEISLTILFLRDSYWMEHTSTMYILQFALFALSIFSLSLIKKMHDINSLLEEKVSQRVAEVEHLYLHDSLTGLKNRVSLATDLEKSPISGLILIDIDNFHNYNELYGMDIGNKVLQNISSYVEASPICQRYDLYRIYGDHFILKITDDKIDKTIMKDDINEIISLFQNYKMSIDNLNDILDIDITIGASIGKDSTLKLVEMALKYAKRTKKKYIIYTQQIDNTSYSQELIVWKDKIKKAVSTDNIVPVYQAIVDTNGTIIKYESLMRLREYDNKNEESLISPFFFLDIAIKSKIYPQLTAIMIDKSFKDMKKHGYEFSINLTFEDMINEEMVSLLKKQIKKYDIGKQIIFEIVESENIDDFPYAKKFVKAFKAMGVRIAIDDFGTGYSNFTHIFELEPDYLKIDGSLIKNIEHDKKSYELVASIIYFSKSLGIKTIAEFVSNKEIFEICKKLGIDQFQGYYFCEPIVYDKLLEHEKDYQPKVLT